MNYSSLTISEIMRMADPKTDLEVALFNHIKNGERESDEKIADLESGYSEMEDRVHELDVMVLSMTNGIERAISSLCEIAGADEIISELQKLI